MVPRLGHFPLDIRTLVELETGLQIKAVHYDNTSEYKSLGTLFEQDYGIQFEYTTLYTPEQNGVSEQLNKVLVTMARAMLLDAQLTLMFRALN
jgi:transposase InsO family protein